MLTKSLFTILLVIANLMAATTTYANNHQHHSLMGYHGMVIFADKNNQLYASHLPLYSTPHNYQIIYKISTEKGHEVNELLTSAMVTLLPEKFDLTKLIEKQQFTLSATVFSGHFERGGDKAFETKIKFEKAVVVKKVNANFSQSQSAFYIETINDTQALWVHKIQNSPSFDAIGFIDLQNAKQLTKGEYLNCKKPVSLTTFAIENQLNKCGLQQMFYLETRDFS